MVTILLNYCGGGEQKALAQVGAHVLALGDTATWNPFLKTNVLKQSTAVPEQLVSLKTAGLLLWPWRVFVSRVLSHTASRRFLFLWSR